MVYTANRVAGLKPFKKGQSGNPSGRPKKVLEVAALARDSAVKAMETLIKLMDSHDERVALQASNAVLDRVHGKPKQAVAEVSRGSRPMVKYTTAELHEILALGRAN